MDRITSDLAHVDQDVARAFDALTRWRDRLARDPEAYAGVEPLESFRWVSGKTVFDELGALRVGAHEVELRDALRRWVYTLLQARLQHPLDVDGARAAAEPRGRYAGDAPRFVSVNEAKRGLVASKSHADAQMWLDALALAAAPLGAIARERRGRRIEIAARLNLGPPAQFVIPVPLASLAEAARALLARTSDIASFVLRESRPKGADPHPVDGILLAVGRDAPEGWPSQLTPRWLEDLFGSAVRGLKIDLPPLAPPLGGASFARALGAFGYAFRVAASARAPRFALAREPHFTQAHRFSYAFASLPISRDFQRIALHLGERATHAQARVFARIALLEVRLAAARLLLADDVGPEARYEEITEQLFGTPLPRALAGVFPAYREDEAARFLGLLTAPLLVRDLVQRFDSDWFANPRALPDLAVIGASPDREGLPKFDGAALIAPLAASLEESLA